MQYSYERPESIRSMQRPVVPLPSPILLPPSLSHGPSISNLNAVVGVFGAFTAPGSPGATTMSVLPDAELGISVDEMLLSVNEFFVSPPTVDAALAGTTDVTVLLSLVPPAVVLLPCRRVAPDIMAAR